MKNEYADSSMIYYSMSVLCYATARRKSALPRNRSDVEGLPGSSALHGEWIPALWPFTTPSQSLLFAPPLRRRVALSRAHPASVDHARAIV
jgi:hypothetical protein